MKALQILRETDQYNGAFTASEGWLRGFLRRKNYTLRRITTTGRDLPSDFLETIVQFHKDCEINLLMTMNLMLMLSLTWMKQVFMLISPLIIHTLKR